MLMQVRAGESLSRQRSPSGELEFFLTLSLYQSALSDFASDQITFPQTHELHFPRRFFPGHISPDSPFSCAV